MLYAYGEGTLVSVLANAAAAVLSTQNYDSCGQSEGGTQPAIFGYTGELQDGTGGAVYLRARWYQPGTGTLLGVDPKLDSTGQAYAYAAGDPVNGSDPSGECWMVVRSQGELRNYPRYVPQTECSTDTIAQIARQSVYAASVYDLPPAVTGLLLDHPGVQFATWDQQASLAIARGARLVFGAAYVASIEGNSGGKCWACGMLDALGSTATGTAHLADTALPTIHDVAVGLSVLATACAIASSETVIGGVSCGAITFAATFAAAETGSVLNVEGREGDTAAVLDESSLALGGVGHVAELGAAVTKGLAGNADLVAAASRAEAAAAGGLGKLGPWVASPWWTVKADFWRTVEHALVRAANLTNGVAATLSLLGVSAELYDRFKGDCT